MPYLKKKYIRRRPYRRFRGYKKKKKAGSKISKLLTPPTYRFKRSLQETLILNSASAPTNWTALENGIVITYSFSLSSINARTDFTNLYKQYRLKGVRMTGYYSNTQSTVYNSNTLMYMIQSPFGNTTPTDLTETFFLDHQLHKRKVCLNSRGGKCFDIFTPLFQLQETYAGTLNTDYALTRPRWISSKEPDTPHYGVSMRLQRVDGNPWTTSSENEYPSIKIIYTLYLECRHVF